MREGLATAPQFPRDAFEQYALSLALSLPQVRKAARGLSDDFFIHLSIFHNKLTLVLAAQLDKTTITGSSAEFIRVANTLLGRDWGFNDHGQVFIIERANEEIALALYRWLQERLGALTT